MGSEIIATSGYGICSSYIIPILDMAEAEYQIERDDLLKVIGLKSSFTDESPHFLPLYHFTALLLFLYHVTGDRDLTLKIGHFVQIRSAHLLGYLMANCENFWELAGHLATYEAIASNLGKTSFSMEKDNILINFKLPADESRWSNSLLNQLSRELLISGIINIGRSILDDHGALLEVRFPYSKPENHRSYERYLHCPVSFNSQKPGILLNRRILSAKIKGADPAFKQLMERQTQALLTTLDKSLLLPVIARKIISKELESQDFSQEKVSSTLGITTRCFHNRLKKQNLTFRGLVDDVRRSKSFHLLLYKQTSLADISLRLGFADQSAFTRAFKRWSDTNPGDFRSRFHNRYYKNNFALRQVRHANNRTDTKHIK